MDRNLKSLKPESVWARFAEIVRIPRPSHSEDKIRRYLVEFAENYGIEHCVDEAGNVYMHKGATAGMENRKGLILQAHVDMVAQKNKDKEFDFENDPIDAYIDGDRVTADGTTLGADNGIGVAAALAVMSDDKLTHGQIEALFTATEETGMDGAFGLKPGLLKGDILLNLDSEAEGELYVGCAGGLDANVTLPYVAVAAPAGGYAALRLSVRGCKGGHSGIQIICQRANANRLLFRLLRRIARLCDMKLCSVDGGGLRNAIPREAEAVVMVPCGDVEKVKAAAAEFLAVVTAEFAGIEDAIAVEAAAAEPCAEMIPDDVAARLMAAMVACHDGVARISTAMEGLVQTSNNVARVVSDGKCVTVNMLMRSSVRSEKEALADSIEAVFTLAGAEVAFSGGYDGWNPNMDSPILKTMIGMYEQLYGRRPAVTAIHAGLECGIIGGKYPNLDMISFGPTINYPHSPDENVEIESVQRFYDFLIHTIENAPEK